MFKFLIYLYTLLTIVRSECDVCNSASNVACITENSFKICNSENKIVRNASTITCPQGYFCNSRIVAICGANIQPECISECGRCSTDGKFACLNETTYALCLGTATPSTVTGQCGRGTVCDINTPLFCKPAKNGTGSCLSRQEVTTVAPPVTLATTYCTMVARNPGKYPVFNSSCQSYVECYFYGNDLLGQEHTCPNATLFDPVRQECNFTYQCVQ